MSDFIRRNVLGTAQENSGRISGYGIRIYDPLDAGTEYVLRAKRSAKSQDVVAIHERIVDYKHLEPLTRTDVVCAFNHDANRVLGRTTSGTMTLLVDARGMTYDTLPLPNDPIIALTARGDIRGASFAGFEEKREFFRSGDQVLCHLLMRTINDIGPVTHPAYHSTSASQRSAELLPDETVSKWIDRMTAQQRRRRTLVWLGLNRQRTN